MRVMIKDIAAESPSIEVREIYCASQKPITEEEGKLMLKSFFELKNLLLEKKLITE